MNKIILATGALCALATQASAHVSMPAPARAQIVDSVRADCMWVDNKWTYKRGDKMLVCRPDRPRGAGWTWYRDGGREGWYHKSRKEWSHKNW